MTDQDPIPVYPPPNNHAITVTWKDGSPPTTWVGCSPHTIEGGVLRFTGVAEGVPQSKLWEVNWAEVRFISSTPVP